VEPALGGDGTTTGAGGCVLACRLPASEANRAVARACEARGVPVRTLHPADAAALPAADGALVLCRLPSGVPAAWAGALLPAERAGRAFLNRPSALLLAHDKPRALAALAAAGLPVPPTVVVQRDGPAALAALPGERFVVKPVSGAAGRGVTMGLSRERAALCAAAFAELSGPVLVQPVLGDGVDRRLFVVGDAVAACFLRHPAAQGGRASLLYGGHGAPWSPDADELALGLAAVRALGLDIAGVDLLRTPDGPVVLEVNACPGLAGIARATGQDLAASIAGLVHATLASTARAAHAGGDG
jgi:ribosomal protein S6--L-glutamate ligase